MSVLKDDFQSSKSQNIVDTYMEGGRLREELELNLFENLKRLNLELCTHSASAKKNLLPMKLNGLSGRLSSPMNFLKLFHNSITPVSINDWKDLSFFKCSIKS